MTHHENKWLNSEKSSTVLFYKWYSYMYMSFLKKKKKERNRYQTFFLTFLNENILTLNYNQKRKKQSP